MAKIIEHFSSATDQSYMVIGYGNPSGGDDAVGQEIVSRLKTMALPNVKVYSVQQLRPELSSQLARTDIAIFVDACHLERTDTVRIKPLKACGSETTGSVVPASGHSCDPSSLLALTQSVYGHFPKAWWIEVPAHDFISGHKLSDLAEKGIVKAIQAIKQLISSGGHYDFD